MGQCCFGSAKLASGTALFSTILLPAGKRKLKAHYNGDSIHDTSTSSAVLATVFSHSRKYPGRRTCSSLTS